MLTQFGTLKIQLTRMTNLAIVFFFNFLIQIQQLTTYDNISIWPPIRRCHFIGYPNSKRLWWLRTDVVYRLGQIVYAVQYHLSRVRWPIVLLHCIRPNMYNVRSTEIKKMEFISWRRRLTIILTHRTAISSGTLFPYQYCRARKISPQFGHSMTEPLHAYFARPYHDVSFELCAVIFTTTCKKKI